uniref:RING-type domain-containing protein n=1 Tax=Rhabditophanes sp. KR3021 TaxID=114890 RepID=A0AC35TW25_9BILA
MSDLKTAPRICQQDASILDNEIESLIFDSFKSICQSNTTLAFNFQRAEDEVHILSKSILWLHRLIKGVTPGQQLMDIKYSAHGLLRFIVHYLFEVILPYLRKYFPKLIGLRFEILSNALDVVKQILFLAYGKYLTISETVLKVSPMKEAANLIGSPGTSNEMEREFLFHLFKDASLVFLPIIYAVKTINWKNLFIKCTGKGILENGSTEDIDTKPFEPVKCSSCNEDAILPVRNALNLPNSCYHTFCYYCYNPDISCPLCNLTLPSNGYQFIF